MKDHSRPPLAFAHRANPDPPTAWQAFKRGFGVSLGEKRIGLGVYLLNAAWTAAWTGPLIWLLSAHLAKRPAGQALATRWDLEILAELLMKNPEVASLGVGLAFYAALTYLLVSALITGGVLGAAGKTGPRRGSFGRSALRSFPSILTTQLLYAIPGVVVAILILVSISVGMALSEQSSPPVRLAIAALTTVPSLVLAVLWDGALDYSRIWAVIRRHTNVTQAGAEAAPPGSRLSLRVRLRFAWRCLTSGWAFLWERGMSAVWLHFGFLLVALVLALTGLIIPMFVDRGGWSTIACVLVAQLFVASRVVVRIAALCAQRDYMSPEPDEEPGGDVPPVEGQSEPSGRQRPEMNEPGSAEAEAEPKPERSERDDRDPEAND